MLNVKTNRVIHSRDIIWLNTMYKDWINEKPTLQFATMDDNYDDQPTISAISKERIPLAMKMTLTTII